MLSVLTGNTSASWSGGSHSPTWARKHYCEDRKLWKLTWEHSSNAAVGWFKDLGCRWAFRPGEPQPRGHRLAAVRGWLGTRRHSRRRAASEAVSSVFTAAPCRSRPHPSPASRQISRGVYKCHVLESSRSHLPAPCPWKNCLPWKPVTINVSHDCLHLEGHPGPCLDAL